MLRGWHLCLLSVLAFYCFYINLQGTTTIHFWSRMALASRIYKGPSHLHVWRRTNPINISISDCDNVKKNILKKSLKLVDANDVKKFVNELRQCPWQYNEFEHNKLKLVLGSCCNARHMLLVTQDNAPLGYKLKYETNPSKIITMTKKIHHMLPKISPFLRKPFKTCAVVGNGGILQNSFCGKEIDSMDFVFRLNLPPLNLAEDIGTKSHFVSANPSILIKKFGRLLERRKPFIDNIKLYDSAMIVLPAFSYVHNTDVSFRALYSVEDFSLENKVAFFHPEYLRNLSSHWKEMGIKANRLSSGLMLVSSALELCNKIQLYGFWPFPTDPDGNNIPHHYYDNIYPKPGFHSMPDEFYLYLKMHSKGALFLQTGKC